MLALLTGIPGYGKTAHALDWVFWQNSDFTALDRYVDGVSGLDNVQCPHFEFPSLLELRSPRFVPLSSVDDDGEDANKYKPWLPDHPDYQDHLNALRTAKHSIELWYLWAQKGSVILIDEAQRFFRPRPSGSKVPLFVSMLEYHRHFGIHFLLTSQAPRLIDLHVRSLTEKHVHLDKNWKGGVKYEWPSVRDIESKADKKEAAKSVYSPPAHVFPFYKSSSLHLKVKHKIPKIVYLVAACVFLFVLLAVGAVWKIKHDRFVDTKKPKVVAAPVGDVSIEPASGVAAAPDFSPGAVTRYVDQFRPVVPALPESAHAFDSMRKVVAMPMISACASMGERCRCYSQQGTYLPSVSVDRCMDILAQGSAFNPYVMAVAPATRSDSVRSPVAPAAPAARPSMSVPAPVVESVPPAGDAADEPQPMMPRRVPFAGHIVPVGVL